MLSEAKKTKLAKRLAARPRNRLTEQDREDIAKRYADGEEVQVIASYYKVSKVTCYKWIQRAAL